jgi:AraC-like DNA-binding protein
MITNTTSPRIVALPSLRSAIQWKDTGRVALHTHEEVELVFVMHGNISIQAGRTYLCGKPGSLFILPAKRAHQQICEGRWHTLCVLFTNYGEVIDESPRVIEGPWKFQVLPWLLELAALYISTHPVPKIVYDSLLLALLSQISHLERNLKVIEALPPRLGSAVQYLQQNVSHEVDTDALTQAAGVSYSRLGALFRDHFDCAPLKYHQQLRLDMAKKHLLNPYISIEEVADQVGFADINYFCRLFRKTFGTPPGKWRKVAATSKLREARARN